MFNTTSACKGLLQTIRIAPAGIRGADFVRPSVRCYGFGGAMHDNDPGILHEEKEKALSGETTPTNPDHANWNEKLASTAEAVVKAEKTEDRPMEELQEFTVKALHGDAEEHAEMKKADLEAGS